jgi:hypothetical protein
MVDAAVALRPEFSLDALKITVRGKLVEQRQQDGVFYSVLLMARGDEYSQPMPFEIRSKKSLGARDAVVTTECSVGGYYRRSYKHTDQNTGEVRTVRPIVMTLDQVEF